MGISLTNKAIDKYFRLLSRLDNSSKRKLIVKLTESIEVKDEKDFNLRDLYGAWEDSRDSDEIIKEIKESRVEKDKIIKF